MTQQNPDRDPGKDDDVPMPPDDPGKQPPVEEPPGQRPPKRAL